ncbi:sigma-70 family RNA polymerase sigma factor [Aeromicrobium phragmitis]|uniref:Sigma-70 family RNA polymerase sigma factor n=1 Tax=Aeromicrobium phragmitis TaxID=2478914 RepID=A0A3L8PM79_9ACTN|nr:ECF RNA polymerase sigma factor SigK [Aeromicrobium phragmitis]RLV55853.1 sigma-70 family RNA polymerase sigma factor [Aeromicrobium phragmitis]
MSHLTSVPSGPEPEGTDLATELLRRCARDDDVAFAQLYDLTAPRVFGLVRRVVRDPGQAEEVTQEVYLELWRHASRFDAGRSSALAWVFTIAHRRAVDRVRSAEAAGKRDVVYGHRHREVAHDATSEVVQDRWEARRVRAALETLTPIQRKAVDLAFFGGYTHSEIAVMLDIPLGTAKTRVRDGLIRLRDALGAEGS